MESVLSPEIQVKVESAKNDIRRCEETGNPQYLYYAQQKLRILTEDLRYDWRPEPDAK